MSDSGARGEPKRPVLDYHTPGTAADERWTNLFTADGTHEAELAVARLQAHGLHARVDGANASPLGSAMGPSALLAPRVQVLAGDVEAARALLAEVEQRRARRRERSTVRCAKCGTVARQLPHPVRRLGVALLLAFLLIAVVAAALDISSAVATWNFLLIPLGVVLLVWSVTPRWVCPACGARWSQREPTDDDLDDEGEDDLGDKDDADDDNGPKEQGQTVNPLS
jgi:hypothetical protein